MIQTDTSTRPDPLTTIHQLITTRYSDAKTVFWGGSIANGDGTSASDLDLVIVFETIPQPYREAFIYDGWPIDAFVNDYNSLNYFFEESRTGNGIAGLLSMIIQGREITPHNNFSQQIKGLAQSVYHAGPISLTTEQINKERFFITDILHDTTCPASHAEQVASGARLYEKLAQFYLRSNKKWSASGKSIVRRLTDENAPLAQEYVSAFNNVFTSGNTIELEQVTGAILAPHGGLLWDGFLLYSKK